MTSTVDRNGIPRLDGPRGLDSVSIDSTTLDQQEGPKMVPGQWCLSLIDATLSLSKVLQGERLALPWFSSTLPNPSVTPPLAQDSMLPACRAFGHTWSAVGEWLIVPHFRVVVCT